MSGYDRDPASRPTLDVETSEIGLAGYTLEDARDAENQYARHTLAIPRKPIKKSISSHFRENISPTTPTVGPSSTRFSHLVIPDAEIELVSPESAKIELVSPESTSATVSRDGTSGEARTPISVDGALGTGRMDYGNEVCLNGREPTFFFDYNQSLQSVHSIAGQREAESARTERSSIAQRTKERKTQVVHVQKVSAAEVNEVPVGNGRPLSFMAGDEDIGLQTSSAPSAGNEDSRIDPPCTAFAGFDEPFPSPQIREYTPYQDQERGSSDDLLQEPTTEPKRPEYQPYAPRRTHNESRDGWLLEFLSLLVSVVAIIAIIVILKAYDDQPLNKLPSSMALNSLLGLFTAFAEAGLVLPIAQAISQLKWVWFKDSERSLMNFETFDQASRGPVGSLKFLGTLKLNHLASVGAIISILALATSPMTQQTISYHEKLVPANSTSLAQASRSDLFMAYSPLRGSIGVPDLSMQQAVKMGIFNAANETIPLTNPSCPSGTCTWPTYSSLSICSKTANVTSFLNSPSSSTNISSLPVDGLITLPNGAHLQSGFVAINITTLATSPNTSLAFTNSNGPDPASIISNTFIIYQNDPSQNTSSASFSAIEILLHWCVNTYNTATTSGQSSINTTSTSTTIASTNTTITLPDTDGRNGTWEKYGAVSLYPSSTNKSGEYKVDGDANAALSSYMALSLQGWYETGESGGYSTDAAMAVEVALYQTPIEVLGLQGEERTRMQMSGVEGLVGNVARSMGNNVQNRRSVGSPVTGTSWITETRAHVSWGWLSFLLVLLVSTVGFLLATIIKSRNAKLDVLKSRSLVTLCALSSDIKTKVAGDNAKAEGVKVRLCNGADGGWILEEEDGRGKAMVMGRGRDEVIGVYV